MENKCTKCLGSHNDTLHIFNCPENPTVITPEYLWTQPSLTYHILKLERDNTGLDQDKDPIHRRPSITIALYHCAHNTFYTSHQS